LHFLEQKALSSFSDLLLFLFVATPHWAHISSTRVFIAMLRQSVEHNLCFGWFLGGRNNTPHCRHGFSFIILVLYLFAQEMEQNCTFLSVLSLTGNPHKRHVFIEELYHRLGVCTMYVNRYFDKKDVPADLLDCFDEIQVQCGSQWERVVDTPKFPKELRAMPGDDGVKSGYGNGEINTTGSGQKMQNWRNENPPTTTGWRATCEHDAETIPATVLDPFSGSGTTGVVALDLGRAYIGIDISTEYVTELAAERIGGTQIGFGL